ncbi:HAD family phosphatase (plasmid) [Rhizobium oryzihabitans]|uniref:HAD family phosphatase n=1 Tax=Rhizobium oryzihabitans TaxID=2267833 RepID=A0A7L5BR97_9HYPH|nr:MULTISPECIES: HAD family phosphatase [Rhizobium/Agrobacterium group]QIB41459.1 HAD family phosphatase [Rhizobium oryzihabitans]RSC24864.1 HAD family phosphatase [Agrobacterium sp. FDAARGOS_525]
MIGQTRHNDDQLFVLDVGGVFISLDIGKRRAALEAGGLWQANAIPDAFLLEANMQFRLGRISEEDYLHSVKPIYGLSTEQVIQAETALLADVLEEMASFVRSLKSAYRIVCLSNTHALHWKHIYEHMLGPDFFDTCYLSHEMGMEKPEEDIYRAVQQHEKVPPERIIFVDDTLENIQTARRLGWNSIHHISAADTIATIEKALMRKPTARQRS